MEGSYVVLPSARLSYRARLEQSSANSFSYVKSRDLHNRECLRDIVAGRDVNHKYKKAHGFATKEVLVLGGFNSNKIAIAFHQRSKQRSKWSPF